jgi:hypothetical protein
MGMCHLCKLHNPFIATMCRCSQQSELTVSLPWWLTASMIVAGSNRSSKSYIVGSSVRVSSVFV